MPKKTAMNIDFKSLIIGILLSIVLFLFLQPISVNKKDLGNITVSSIAVKKKEDTVAVLEGNPSGGIMRLYDNNGDKKIKLSSGLGGFLMVGDDKSKQTKISGGNTPGISVFDDDELILSLLDNGDRKGDLRFWNGKRNKPTVVLSSKGGKGVLLLRNEKNNPSAVMGAQKGVGVLGLFDKAGTNLVDVKAKDKVGTITLMKYGRVKWSK